MEARRLLVADSGMVGSRARRNWWCLGPRILLRLGRNLLHARHLVTSLHRIHSSSTMASSSHPKQQNPSPSSLPDPIHHQHEHEQRHAPALDDADSDNARDSDADHDHDAADLDQDADEHGVSSRKRKRPMSVSCELCKQRKVKCESLRPVFMHTCADRCRRPRPAQLRLVRPQQPAVRVQGAQEARPARRLRQRARGSPW